MVIMECNRVNAQDTLNINISREALVPPISSSGAWPLTPLESLCASQDRPIPGHFVVSSPPRQRQGQSIPKHVQPRRFFPRADSFGHCCSVLPQLGLAARCVPARTTSAQFGERHLSSLVETATDRQCPPRPAPSGWQVFLGRYRPMRESVLL